MTTQTIKEKIKNEFEIENELFQNYFADAVESANNSAIDSTAEVFSLEEYGGLEFYEDGVHGIEDEELSKKIDSYYFNSFEKSLLSKAKGIVAELTKQND